MPSPPLHRRWLPEQSKAISKALAGGQAELLMGSSVSRDRTRSHDPAGENMRNGLVGICASVQAASGMGRTVAGIGVHASSEADEQDWSEWLARQAAPVGQPSIE